MAKKYHGKKMGGGFCGLPEEKVMKPYPKGNHGGPEDYQDSREALDSQASHAHSQMMKDRYKR